MKKLLVFIFLFTSLIVSSQEEFKNKHYLGISQGLNISRASFSSSLQGMFQIPTDQEFKTGYNGGVVFIYYSQPNMGIQMELNYSERGWGESLDSASFYSRRLNYIEFPFLSHFDIRANNLGFVITFGPTVSYMLSSKELTSTIDEEIRKSYYDLAIDNRLDAGLCLGVGVSALTRNGIIQLECRLNMGLSNMFIQSTDFDFPASQNQVLGLRLSYLFNMNK